MDRMLTLFFIFGVEINLILQVLLILCNVSAFTVFKASCFY